MKLNSFFVFIRTLKTLLNNVIKEDVVPESYAPFKNYDFKKFRRIKTSKRSLTPYELEKILNYTVNPMDKYYDSLSYFKFSFYCRGINFTDMAYLKGHNILGNRLEYVRAKTSEKFSIELLPPAQSIIDQYKIDNIEFVFPILNEKHQTPTQIDNRIEKVLKKTNKDLKEIANQLGIEGKITTYVARHSFATHLKRKGVPTAVISEMMGHDSEKTTAIYLAEFENSVLDEAAKLLL